MAATLGALTPWLHREFLSQRNAHGDNLPTTPVEEKKRVQLIRATGMTEEDGETLVWAEMSDGELWIDCCIPLAVVEEYNSKTARTFAASSQSKCIFRLLSWRFAIASPLIAPHGQRSPRKPSALAATSTSASKTHEPRVCLRIDGLAHFGMGEGTMQADYTPFRHVTLDAARVRGEGTEDAARRARERKEKEERAAWVRRLEDRARGKSEGQQQGPAPRVEEQVAFMDDLPRASTTTIRPATTAQQKRVPAEPSPAAPQSASAFHSGWPTDKNAPLPRIDFGEVEALLNRYKWRQRVQHAAASKDDGKGKGKAKAVEPETAASAPLVALPVIDGDWTSASALLTRKTAKPSLPSAPPPALASKSTEPARPRLLSSREPLLKSPVRPNSSHAPHHPLEAAPPSSAHAPAAILPRPRMSSPLPPIQDDAMPNEDVERGKMGAGPADEGRSGEDAMEDDLVVHAVSVDKGKKRASPSPSPSPSSSRESSILDDHHELAAPSPKRRRSTYADSCHRTPRFVPVIPLEVLDYVLWCSMRGLVA